EDHGYLLVSPLGWNPMGAYGTCLRLPAVFGQAEPAAQQRTTACVQNAQIGRSWLPAGVPLGLESDGRVRDMPAPSRRIRPGGTRRAAADHRVRAERSDRKIMVTCWCPPWVGIRWARTGHACAFPPYSARRNPPRSSGPPRACRTL